MNVLHAMCDFKILWKWGDPLMALKSMGKLNCTLCCQKEHLALFKFHWKHPTALLVMNAYLEIYRNYWHNSTKFHRLTILHLSTDDLRVILFFDNGARDGLPRRDYSRVLNLNPQTNSIKVIYESDPRQNFRGGMRGGFRGRFGRFRQLFV